MKAKKKKIWILVIVLILLAAAAAGVWFTTRSSKEPVPVFPFRYVGMTEYWGDNQESYGPVSTDRIQTVYITDTQTVTEIAVSQGDTVKKGDLLMTFDTTLSDLAVERKRLGVEKLRLQLKDEKERLREIRAMKPMVVPQPSDDSEEEDTDTGEQLEGNYRLSHNVAYDGSSKETALICWLNTGASVDDALLETIRLQAEEFINHNKREQWESAPQETQPMLLAEEETEQVPQESQEPQETEESQETEAPQETEDPQEPQETQPGQGPYVPVTVTEYYVILKVTQGNAELGTRLTWQGIHVRGDEESGFRFKLFDAHGIPDHMLEEDEEMADTSVPEIDYGSGYTAAQIAEMRRDQEKKIKDLEFEIKMAEADYQIMLTEVSDGNVYAQIDGEVVSVLSEEEARMLQQPIVKLSGGGGFYIEGSISELEKENLKLGQEVTVNDWNTGMTYTGKVTAVGDFPSMNNGWNGIGNPNASYYPFTAFVDETADLQAGSYVSIQFSTSGTEHGLYLENPFIRSEQGNSYVYLRGADGKLEKRFISVGKSLWGSYKEVLSGLTEEDLIAFPYGKDLAEGADTVESDLSVLYE